MIAAPAYHLYWETFNGQHSKADDNKADCPCCTGLDTTWSTLTGTCFWLSQPHVPGDTTLVSGSHTTAARPFSHPSSPAPAKNGTILRRTQLTSQRSTPSRGHWRKSPSTNCRHLFSSTNHCIYFCTLLLSATFWTCALTKPQCEIFVVWSSTLQGRRRRHCKQSWISWAKYNCMSLNLVISRGALTLESQSGTWGCATVMTPFFQASRHSVTYQCAAHKPYCWSPKMQRAKDDGTAQGNNGAAWFVDVSFPRPSFFKENPLPRRNLWLCGTHPPKKSCYLYDYVILCASNTRSIIIDLIRLIWSRHLFLNPERGSGIETD